jgi:hypothetical protein
MKLGQSYIGNVGVFYYLILGTKYVLSGLPLKTLMFRCLNETQLQNYNGLTLKEIVLRYILPLFRNKNF